MKFIQIENEIIELRKHKDMRDKMYMLLLQVTENDLDNMDIARKLIGNKELTDIQKVKMVTKLQAIFDRRSPSCDGDCSFNAWMEYIKE